MIATISVIRKTWGGFTLIELMVVISIIALLSSTVVAAMTDARKSATDAASLIYLDQLRTAIMSYYYDHGDYPMAETGYELGWVNGYQQGVDILTKQLIDGNYISSPISFPAGYYPDTPLLFLHVCNTAHSGFCDSAYSWSHLACGDNPPTHAALRYILKKGVNNNFPHNATYNFMCFY